ncbi:nucleoporin NSP1 [Favolaschia claudopus]|uniref:Nucleoporin NSP1 n=1 Tax=Favolaschia claudopus TaxID=2862362 RepID=A0AAW0EBM4_9AGAR
MSFFNNPAGASGSAFGANPSTTAPATSNIFGAPAAGAKPPGNSLFGGATTTSAAPASTGLFGNNTAAPAAPATGGIFGGAAPAKSLFGAPSAPAATSNIFGSTAGATTPSAPSTSNPLFGGGLPKPADPAANAPKPATSNFFGLGGNSSTPAAPATASPFGLPAKPADAPSTTAPASNLFAKPGGGNNTDRNHIITFFTWRSTCCFNWLVLDDQTPAAGSFFAKPAATSTTPASTAPAASPFSLGGAKKWGCRAWSALPSLFAPKTEDKKDAPTVPTLGATSLIKPPEAPKAPGALSAAPSAAPVVAVAPPSMLRGKTIEEIVNKWSGELETHVREFNKFAGEVAVWDRALIENGNNLAALYSHVLAAEREQNDIDQSLDHIEQQQKDLSSTLDAYEKATQEVFGHSGSLRALDTGPADTERDKNYMLATDLHTQLDDMSGSLTQMIEAVNTLSLPDSENAGDDPMGQIAQILGSHLESLQWIDGAVREVETKVTEVEKRVKDSGYNPGASTGAKRGGYGL